MKGVSRNEEFIHRHLIGECSKCGEKFYGGSVFFAKLVSYDGLGAMRCNRCGNVDSWMERRTYGLKRNYRGEYEVPKETSSN